MERLDASFGQKPTTAAEASGALPDRPASPPPAPHQPPPLPVYARLYEEEQKVDGPSRWTVGAARRTCATCSAELPEASVFHTALTPATEPRGPTFDAAEIFLRRDFCQGCFDRLPKAECFAHWRSVVPAGGEPARRIVNVAALFAYFEQLHSAVANDANAPLPGGGSMEQRESPDDDGRVATSAAHASSEQSPRPDVLLTYLLALFLVRKRQLRWIALSEQRLLVESRLDARQYQVPVPPKSVDIEAAQASFEALFAS